MGKGCAGEARSLNRARLGAISRESRDIGLGSIRPSPTHPRRREEEEQRPPGGVGVSVREGRKRGWARAWAARGGGKRKPGRGKGNGVGRG